MATTQPFGVGLLAAPLDLTRQVLLLHGPEGPPQGLVVVARTHALAVGRGPAPRHPADLADVIVEHRDQRST